MDRRTPLVVLSLVALAIFVAGLTIFHYIPDDTFITLRYARHAIDGAGFVFNAGERVEGYTNFLWLLILIALGKLGLSLVPLARTLSLAFSAGTLVLAAVAARRAGSSAGGGVPESGRGGWGDALRTLLPTMMLAAAPPVLVWSLSGTEMPLFTFLLLAGYLLLAPGRRPGAALVLFALLGLVRPEGTLFFAIAFVRLIVPGPRRLRILGLAAGIVAVFYVPYLAWKWRYFHSLLPNTFYAKTGPAGLMLSNGARYAGGFVLRYGYLVVAGVALLGAAAWRRWLLPVVLAAASLLVTCALGGDWMPHDRLLLPAIPFVALIAADGAVEAARRAGRSPVFGIALVLLVMLPGAARYDLFTTERTTVAAFERLGQRLAVILPPGTSIGCGSTGAIGYYTGMPVIDILGLTEPQIARHGAVVGTQPGHLKADGAYVFSRRPDLLLLGNVRIQRRELDRGSLPVKVQEAPILEQPGFDDAYEFVNVPLGNGFYLSCFKLKSYFLPLAPAGSTGTAEAPRR